jgi:hypothetical protein
MPPPSYSRAPLTFTTGIAQKQLQSFCTYSRHDFSSVSSRSATCFHVLCSATHPAEGIDAIHPAAGCLGAGNTLKHAKQAFIAGAILLNASQQRTPAIGPYEVHLPCPWEAPAHAECSDGHMMGRAAMPSPSSEGAQQLWSWLDAQCSRVIM